ncbi:GDP-mannose 4,6-dehydratase [Candidatus Microgenomates bacterium]|nr:GDP-mannose 4,6-dehydratase [Candidatus Microgenomates bacterium]
MRLLITGGVGFIGSNLAAYFLKKGHLVTVFDNFSRKGTKINAAWLKKEYPQVRIVEADVRNFLKIKKEVVKTEVIFHLAGQVAVTTSIENPREDFESNLSGSFNLLEAARKAPQLKILIYASTNKVYGSFSERIIEKKKRYLDLAHKEGINENQPLDFCSPYGCSKGSADQYVKDYARIYGLPTVVFRQSCIYGERQFGVEDQGWVAHFVVQCLKNKPITIYGSGKQIRDILYIDDLIKAYLSAIEKINKIKGGVFNIGGGINNTLSLLELIQKLEEKLNKKINLNFQKERPGDQKVYISNIKKAKKMLNWQPKIGIDQGLDKLIDWVKTLF